MNKKILITLRLIAGILTILALSATVEAKVSHLQVIPKF